MIHTPERHLPLDGTRNVRDVGGYATTTGRATRWRTLLRSDELTRIPEHAQQELLDLGLRQVIDLRWPEELERSPNVFVESPVVRYTSVPLLADDPTPFAGLAGMYLHVFDARAPQLADVARALLADGGLPAIIGCAAGKDRTGVSIALLLDLVGVPTEAIVEDYALSAGYFATAARRDRRGRLAPSAARRGLPAGVHGGRPPASRSRARRRPGAAAQPRAHGRRARPAGRPAHRAGRGSPLMGRVGSSLQVNYPAEVVFRVATRVEELPTWLPEVVAAELLDPTFTVGSRVRLKVEIVVVTTSRGSSHEADRLICVGFTELPKSPKFRYARQGSIT